jgi:LysM repeat protein
VALEKAIITPNGGQPIPVLFNPTQYSLDKSNQIAEIGIPGLGAPILQYVRGNVRTLSMELFFDTYEQQTDVREHTNQIYELLAIDSGTHVPPVCTFTWGEFNFEFVLDRVGGRFTLFLSDGTPVRATLTVTLKEFTDVAVEVRANPTQSADHTKTSTVKRGDTLSSIAAAEYGDPAAWRPIAQANRIDNPRVLEPGRLLVIPPLRSGPA